MNDREDERSHKSDHHVPRDASEDEFIIDFFVFVNRMNEGEGNKYEEEQSTDEIQKTRSRILEDRIVDPWK